ncbi:MAG: DinB family protein [Bacteroidetes bacterium]|nr:DinB family protein [Bacteroidota bacterium]MCL5738519.1 DinB family protein [Bacteroidota bacterium]
MNKRDIVELLEYSQWAKSRLLNSLEPMKQEDFEKDLHSSHGGVRGTLFHILNAENFWLRRLTGEPVVSLDEAKLKNLNDFKQEWDQLDKRLSELVNGLSEEQVQASFEYQDRKGNKYAQPRIQLLHQLVSHFTYHRGQIVAMQRQLGYQPANTDLIVFYREKKG